MTRPMLSLDTQYTSLHVNFMGNNLKVSFFDFNKLNDRRLIISEYLEYF